ncbi:Oxalate:formate antiporter [Echinococcus granulosus]|uniref:Oxalate:formate antiporter n=1 Tax=Echinococcus granulosus TaxID=6210 RepID=W6U249_ECHGR|nr:Oxalate:formate antiporter [Echinococcus granulosus]EUB55128.1 Oxalate:formate antiporter [Echinococcus granulosus]
MACCGLAPLGHLTTLANVMPYLASYMHKYTDVTVDYSLAIWLSCCLHAIQGIATPTTTVLISRVGYRPLLLFSWMVHRQVTATSCALEQCFNAYYHRFLACFYQEHNRHIQFRTLQEELSYWDRLNIAGILLTPLTLKVGFAAVISTYAIMVGWGVGASYGLLLALAASWFPKRRGLVVGICACGFGAGAIILTPLQTAIINPQNLAVNNVTQMFEDETMLQRVPKCLYIVGGIMASLQLLGCIFVRPRPEEEESQIVEVTEDLTDNSVEISQNKTALKGKASASDLSPREVLQKVDVYLFWAIMCLSLIPLTLITATIKVVGQRSIPDDKYLSLVSTLGAVFNTLARVGWGPVGDKFSYKVPLCCLNLFYGVILITLPFIPPLPVTGKYLYALWVSLIYFSVAGNFVLLPFGISRAFGHKHFAANYGIVFSAFHNRSTHSLLRETGAIHYGNLRILWSYLSFQFRLCALFGRYQRSEGMSSYYLSSTGEYLISPRRQLLYCAKIAKAMRRSNKLSV